MGNLLTKSVKDFIRKIKLTNFFTNIICLLPNFERLKGEPRNYRPSYPKDPESKIKSNLYLAIRNNYFDEHDSRKLNFQDSHSSRYYSKQNKAALRQNLEKHLTSSARVQEAIKNQEAADLYEYPHKQTGKVRFVGYVEIRGYSYKDTLQTQKELASGSSNIELPKIT